MIIQSKDISKPVRESADVCIIGSGCGGGASAKVLAEAGKKVIVLEEGGYFTSGDFDMTEQTAYQNLYRERAGQATGDLAVTVLQGKCIGGSSTVNWTTSLRTPDFVLEKWAKTFDVRGLSSKDLEPYFERIEKYLNVHVEPEEYHNPNNRIILDGARKLGYHAEASGRNTRDCKRAGACGLGCPFDAKLSVNVTYIPDAVKAGAAVFANFCADEIDVSGRLKRVFGSVVDQSAQKVKTDFIIEAPVVIVAASAIHSPALLLRSGLANSSGEVGNHLTFHLTSAVLGVYDRIIYPAGGIPQSALCSEFLNKNKDGGGFWIEAVPVYPTLASLAIPGFGNAHKELMRKYPNIGASIVLVKEIDSEGSVTLNSYGRPSISYEAGGRDLGYLKEGLNVAAKIHFAAGAKRVMTLHSQKMEFSSPAEIDSALANAEWGANEIALYSAHPLGTCRMAEHPLQSVVDSHCETHDVRGLFVIDGSVTPTSLGVNPQMTILAIAEKSAEWIAENRLKTM
ncbi:MAG TPA: GMC family oxidoreductase [Bacteroidota bacterium]|nr:GMC family oxidoreductase [Bacteroidota bacterium]